MYTKSNWMSLRRWVMRECCENLRSKSLIALAVEPARQLYYFNNIDGYLVVTPLLKK